MAILRAGPFARSSDSFVDEPEEENRSILPVNCANDSTDFWPFRVFMDKREEDFVIIREYTTNINQEANGVAFIDPVFQISSMAASLEFRFAYQAAQNFSFASGSKVEIEYGDTQDLTSWGVNVLGATENFSDSRIEFGAGAQEFNLSEFVFPASVVPRFVTINGTAGINITTNDSFTRVKITIVLKEEEE